MFKIKNNTGKVLEIADTIKYVKFGRNRVPKLCRKIEAEGIVLKDECTICRLVDLSGIEEYEKVKIEEIDTDTYLMEMKKETKEAMLATMEAQAEMAEMIIKTQENQYAIMEALAEMFEAQA